MPILRLLKTEAFNREAAMTLASAFNAAWVVLRKSRSKLAAHDKAGMTRHVLANQIIEIGRAGERDQQLLMKEALAYVASYAMISRAVERLRPNLNGGESSKREVQNEGEVGDVEGESRRPRAAVHRTGA